MMRGGYCSLNNSYRALEICGRSAVEIDIWSAPEDGIAVGK